MRRKLVADRRLSKWWWRSVEGRMRVARRPCMGAVIGSSRRRERGEEKEEDGSGLQKEKKKEEEGCGVDQAE